MWKWKRPSVDLPSDNEVEADLEQLFRVQPREDTPQTPRAYGYIRKSKLDQELPEHSLPSQARRIHDYATANGWEVITIYQDAGVSGRRAQRPALYALERAIRARQVDVVIVDRVDRLFRNLFALLEFVKLLNEYQVSFVSVRENLDYTHAFSKLLLYILGVLAEFYSNVLSEEMRLLREYQAAQGKLSSTYRLGYCNGRCSTCRDPNGPSYCPYAGGPDRHHGAFRIPHPIESLAVKLAFVWYAAGDYSDADIAQRLNTETAVLEDGTEVTFRTKGRPGVYVQPALTSIIWQVEAAESPPPAAPPELRYPPGPFDRDAVRAILTNPVYTGYVAYYGTYTRGEKNGQPLAGKKCKLPAKAYVGKHAPLVELSLYRRVRDLRCLRYHRTTGLAHPARTFPLTGLLYCSVAHNPLRGISSNKGTSRYYADKLCAQQLPRGQRHQRNLRADVLEEQVMALVTALVLPAAWRQRILAYVVYPDGVAEIEREKFALREHMNRARELYVLGDHSAQDYYRVRAACQRQLAALIPESTAAGQEAGQLLDNLPALWASLTPDELKLLYTYIFDVIYVDNSGIVEIKPHPPFAALLENVGLPGAHALEEEW